jgi:hypothetical protein
LAFLAAFLSTCAWAAQAEAGTVSLILQDTAPGSFTELRLTYQAAAGEWNRLSISMTFDQRTWIVSETVAGVTITAGEGCIGVTAQIATCSVPERGNGTVLPGRR